MRSLRVLQGDALAECSPFLLCVVFFCLVQGNIFVNHLARQIDNKQLFDTFSLFGNILSCKVSVNAKRESLGYGFVHYETEESARTAIERVDGKVIAGEKVWTHDLHRRIALLANFLR